MKKKIWEAVCAVALSVVMAISTPLAVSAATVSDFSDISPTAWYYSAVEYATDNGLFSGTGKTTFSPDGAMTRGMFVTVLGRMAGIDESEYLRYRFDDVKVGAYYAPYVEWAATYDIVSGISSTKFSPDAKISREQMAAILYRYAKATENDVAFSTNAYNGFSDTGKVSSWAVEAFQWAADKGIINGSNGRLNPKGTATRAQVAQVFKASKDILVKTEITVDPILPGSADPKTHPNNVYNVFSREFSAENDWQVSSKSRMDAAEQAQLISLLKGKTGNMVWNEIALKGMTTGQVGATRDAYFINAHDGNAYLNRATSIEKVAETILNRLSLVPDAKYICVTLEDAENSTEGTQKDYCYQLYLINTPDAFVDASDSAFTAKVKRLVAERLPSGFVWSNSIAPAGGWSDFMFMPWHLYMTDDELAEEYADFFVYMLYGGGWGYAGEEGHWCYQIRLEEGSNNGHEKLRVYYA